MEQVYDYNPQCQEQGRIHKRKSLSTIKNRCWLLWLEPLQQYGCFLDHSFCFNPYTTKCYLDEFYYQYFKWYQHQIFV